MATGKKTGGRQKGTLNKVKLALLERVNEKYPDYCPIEAMCEIATDRLNDIPIRLQASKEVAQYIYPKLKSVEHSGETKQTTIVIQEYKAPEEKAWDIKN